MSKMKLKKSIKKYIFLFIIALILVFVGVKLIKTYKYHQTYYASPTFMSSDKYFINAMVSKYSTFKFKKELISKLKFLFFLINTIV